MSRVEEIEKSVQALSPEELASFREWFARFDEKAWDEKFERDALAGKLGEPASVAVTTVPGKVVSCEASRNFRPAAQEDS